MWSGDKIIRRYLVGPQQQWAFIPPPPSWAPSPIPSTSMYLHVPFCRNCCPYCPYTKVPYDESLVAPFTRAAIAEVNWWAQAIGPAKITSIYIGGGTPTLALEGVANILKQVRQHFRIVGDICIETNPADVNRNTVQQLHDIGVTLVSLGVQSFRPQNLATLGRCYDESVAARALAQLAASGFTSVNADLMFALPGQKVSDILADLKQAVQLGANQLTTYPLFTFPYTTVGQYLELKSVRLPALPTRRMQYHAIHNWCLQHDFPRVSVWGFKQGSGPRYSSVTRDGYIGIGPGAGSHLPDGFVLNTFGLADWMQACLSSQSAIALRLPFMSNMSGWWWLYWRLYDTRIPLLGLEDALASDAPKAHRWLKALAAMGMARQKGNYLELTESGAFWLHLAQNYFALNYVNTLWTSARRQPWPSAVHI